MDSTLKPILATWDPSEVNPRYGHGCLTFPTHVVSGVFSAEEILADAKGTPVYVVPAAMLFAADGNDAVTPFRRFLATLDLPVIERAKELATFCAVLTLHGIGYAPEA